MPEIPQNLPPADGSLSVLPGFLDFHAEHNPNRPWVIFPSDSQASGTSSISFGEFAKATHRVAHHVRPGRQDSELQVVGIVAHTDAVLYMAVIVGLMRAGIVVSTFKRWLCGVSSEVIHTIAIARVTKAICRSYCKTVQADISTSRHHPGSFPSCARGRPNSVGRRGLQPSYRRSYTY